MTPRQRLVLQFRRTKLNERAPADVMSEANTHTKEPIGSITFYTSLMNGKEYAFVLEQHENLKKGDGGVSLYIKKGS